jgi:hypothetical protein
MTLGGELADQAAADETAAAKDADVFLGHVKGS